MRRKAARRPRGERRWAAAAWAAWAALAWGVLSGGCVAVDAGRPETIEHVRRRQAAEGRPETVEVEDARARTRQTGERVEVRVEADVREVFPVWEHERRVVARKRKRLAFGLFPGAAELVWMPEGALASGETLRTAGTVDSPEFSRLYGNEKPGLGTYALWQFALSVGTCGLVPAIETGEAVLTGLFRPWECGVDVYDPEAYRRDVVRDGNVVAVASGSRKLRALAELPEKEKRAVGANTCFDPQVAGILGNGHLAWAGFHKYTALTVEVGEEERTRRTGAETRRRKARVEGPYEVEFSIPGLGYSQRKRVGRGEDSAEFELPRKAGGAGWMDARVRVRGCRGEEGGAPELTRRALRALEGQEGSFAVELEGAGRGGGGGRYRVAGIRRGEGGRYEVRVEAEDAGGAWGAVQEIAGEVRRRIREDYARRHPEARVEETRDVVEWRAEEGGGTLVFSGWAFSARALSRGWRYDAGTRRGEVRLAVTAGTPGAAAERWARESIEAIAKEKAVALEAGGTLPEGARFEVTGTRCEGGVLTVEFRVVE